MDAAEVKALAKSYGADIVGIASAKVLNAFPPDPQWPQTPERISPYVRSVIVIVQHIPVAVFRAKTGAGESDGEAWLAGLRTSNRYLEDIWGETAVV